MPEIFTAQVSLGPCEDFPEYADFPAKLWGTECVPRNAEGIDDAARNELGDDLARRPWGLRRGRAVAPDVNRTNPL